MTSLDYRLSVTGGLTSVTGHVSFQVCINRDLLKGENVKFTYECHVTCLNELSFSTNRPMITVYKMTTVLRFKRLEPLLMTDSGLDLLKTL